MSRLVNLWVSYDSDRLSHITRKPVSRSVKNQPVKSHKKVTSLTFSIKKEDRLYFCVVKTKTLISCTDQLHCTADLCVLFHIGKIPIFSRCISHVMTTKYF